MTMATNKRKGLGYLQRKVLDILALHPNSTMLEAARIISNKPDLTTRPPTQEYNSVCRAINLLEKRGLIQKNTVRHADTYTIKSKESPQ